MTYDNIVTGTFLKRPNRFIAYVEVKGDVKTCHVKNTGRCQELLVPGCTVVLEFHPKAKEMKRKTEYDLIAVYKGNLLINMDSQAPNQAAYEWLCSQGISPKREVRFGNSRFDLAFEENGVPAFMEVKGVTLEENKTARFPDAPTERGLKHLKELELAAAEGCRAYLLFVIAMKGVTSFEANRATHPEFADALAHAAAHGVHILAYDCHVTPNSLDIDRPVPVAFV